MEGPAASLVLQALLNKLKHQMAAAVSTVGTGILTTRSGTAQAGGVLRAATVGTASSTSAGPGAYAWQSQALQHHQQQQYHHQQYGQVQHWRLHSTSSHGAAAMLATHHASLSSSSSSSLHQQQLGWQAVHRAPPPHWSHYRRQQYASMAAAQAVPASSQQHGAEQEGVVQLYSIVEFKRQQNYILGRVIGQQQGGVWRVEDASGTVFSVHPKDVTYVLPGQHYTSDDLGSLESAAGAAAADATLLDLAWQMSEASALYTVPEMADFLFGDREPPSCAAAHRLLRDDRLYFKQAGRTPPVYSPRTPAQVEQLRQEAARAAAAAAEWQAFAGALEAARAAPRPKKPSQAVWAAGPHAARMAALEALALTEEGGLAGQQSSEAFKILGQLGMAPSPYAAAEVLQAAGYWPPHVQVGLLAAGITEQFDPGLEALAKQLLASPPPDPDAASRLDLTHHTVYTIDDASTTEIDDGLSLERLPDGRTRVWVHIADPTRWVAPGHALDLEARQRTKSLYLPTSMVPMFPLCLAEGPFSLRQGQPSCALSVGAVLQPDGSLAAEDVQIAPSTVVPSQRLTYDTADEMLAFCTAEEEPVLHALEQIAGLRRSWRMACGATEIDMPECTVQVKQAHLDSAEVSLWPEHQFASAARQLVAEMMILAGEAAGLLGGRLGLALPYRGQADPVLPTEAELASVPPGPCRAVLLRQRMVRSVTQAGGPLRHAGLGLAAYVQMTSPIRRYGDLLAHWQLKAALRGQAPPLSEPALKQVMERVGEAALRVGRLEREVTNYWIAEYFRQAVADNRGAAWAATFLCWLKQEAGLGRVLFDDLGLEAVVRINRPLQAGDPLYVRCVHVEVRQGLWRLEEVSPTQLREADVVGAC